MENVIFKYMDTEEFKCPCCGKNEISTQFVNLLDKARKMAGTPFIINSGYRCHKHNKEIDGKPDSAHLKGLAADIQAKGSLHRFLIVKALIDVGFQRIGIYPTFIHADMDMVDKTQEVIWLG